MSRVPLDKHAFRVRALAGHSVLEVFEGARLYVYERGTTTPATGYTTEGGSTQVSYPLLANASGEYRDAWFAPDSYDLYSPDDILNPTTPWEPGVPGAQGPPGLDEGMVFNVRDEAYGALGDGSTDDTDAIQAAIAACATAGGGTVFIPPADPGDYYKLTDTLTVPGVRGLRIVGASWRSSELRMTANNLPILQTVGDVPPNDYQEGLSIEELRLVYETQQTNASHPNSYAIAFSGAGNSWYFGQLRRLQIAKATVGIGIKESGAYYYWGNDMDTILFSSVTHHLIDIQPAVAGGQPPNRFSHISHLDPYAGPDPTGAAILIWGQADLNSLDIEDWKGYLLMWSSGSGSCRNLYTERHTMDNVSNGIVYCDTGVYDFSGTTFSVTVPDGYTSMLWTITDGILRSRAEQIYLTKGTGSYLVHHKVGADARMDTDYPIMRADSLAGLTLGDALSLEGTRVADEAGIAGVQTVASAANLYLPEIGRMIKVSGTDDISMVGASWAGREVVLVFTGTAGGTGLTDGSNLKLAGNLGYTPDDTITLVCDGTNWWETTRSVN